MGKHERSQSLTAPNLTKLCLRTRLWANKNLAKSQTSSGGFSIVHEQIFLASTPSLPVRTRQTQTTRERLPGEQNVVRVKVGIKMCQLQRGW